MITRKVKHGRVGVNESVTGLVLLKSEDEDGQVRISMEIDEAKALVKELERIIGKLEKTTGKRR